MARSDDAHGLHQELQLVLQHSDISTTAVCKLLCVSKGVQAAVMSLMTGRLTVRFCSEELQYMPPAAREEDEEEEVHSFAAFVKRFGLLIKNLDIFVLKNSNISWKTLAAALQYAALQAPGLQVQSFCSDTPVAQLIYQLVFFRTSLTKLDLGWYDLTDDQLSCGHELARASLESTELVLPGLPNLTDLSLDGLPDMTASDLLRSLSGLTAVTRLRVRGEVDPQDLSHLPTQLKELCVTYPGGQGDVRNVLGVNLTHLTVLTMFGSWPGSQPEEVHIITAADRLPSSLCRMELSDVQSMQPLLQLTRLRQLQLLKCEQSLDTVAQLSRLTSLTSLDMTYCLSQDRETPPESAHEHPTSSAPFTIYSKDMVNVPLRGLGLSVILTPGWACLLGKLTGLTSLTMFARNVSAAPQQLATSLSQLPHMRVLKLTFIEEHTTEQFPGSGEGIRELLRAVASRPQLQSLDLSDIPVTTDIAEELRLLGGAPQLTSLVLRCCGLTNTATAVFLPSLPTGLKELNLGTNPQIGDATLELIGQRLQHLTKLAVYRTGVTDRGLEHLTPLWQLKELHIWQSEATAAAKAALLRH